MAFIITLLIDTFSFIISGTYEYLRVRQPLIMTAMCHKSIGDGSTVQ